MTRESSLQTLKKRSDFIQIAASGRKFAARTLVLQVRETPRDSAGKSQGQNVIRVGYTASRRVGNAVTRNRAKRRLRAAVREVFGPKGAPGYDYVLIARQGISQQPFPNVVADLTYALEKLDLLIDA